MRLKGISWIEQHFEKVFAGLFAVLALGVLTWQFAGKPNTVTVGPKKDVPLDTAYDDIVAAARRTKEAVERQSIEEPALPAGSDPISMFEKNYKGPIAPSPELAAAPGRGGDAIAAGGTKLASPMSTPLAPLAIPATTAPVASSYVSTIHPSEADVEGVAAVLPPKPPYDKASVSVEARFDGKKLKAKLEQDPDGPAGPIQPIRKEWWENMQILAFELEREELLPDGKWGKTAKVPAMPGRFSLLAEIEKGVPDMETLVALRTDATDRASEVRRPEFYDLLMGDEWQPPEDRKASEDASRAAAGDGRAQKLAAKKDIERKLDAKREKREEMGPMTGGRGPGGREEPPPPQDRRGGGGAGAGGKRGAGGAGGRTGGGPSGGGAGRPTPPKTYTDGERSALDRQIAELEKQLEQVNKELGVSPMDPARQPDAGRGGGGAGGGAAHTEPSIFELADIRLWAHDVSVERGRTYRYRASVVFNNPFFGKGSGMVPEQAEWARPTLVRSEPSEWSQPVTVDPESYWFIVGASEPGAQLARSVDARAELFVFTMGFWRRGSASIEPGDRIQAEVSVPDVSKLDLKPAATPGQPNPQSPPGVDEPGGGKRGGARRGVAGNEPPPQDQPERGTAAAQMPMINRPVAADAILLGVGSVSLADEKAAARKATQAFLRLGDGSVQTRRPDEQKADPAYIRVSRSADRAKEAAMAKEPEREPGEPRNRPGRDTPAPGGGNAPPPSGSGGG